MDKFLKAITPFAVLLALSILLVLPQIAYASNGQWIKYSGGSIYGPGVLGPTSGAWDSASTSSPRVLYDGTTYRMWYDGGNMTGFAGIGYAVSSDGLTWSKHAGPVLTPGHSGTWDSAAVEVGSVIWNGTLYLMYYRGSNPTTNQAGAIGLATSKDGISWTKYPSNPILSGTQLGSDQGYIASPTVVKLALSYDLWYIGKNVTYQKATTYSRILLATSLDGVHWKKWPAPVFSPATDTKAWDSAAVYSPQVYWNGTTFGLWYTGLGQSLTEPGIGVATSPDGSTWTRSSYNPILSPGPSGAWDSAGVEQPSVVLGRNGYMLFYDGLGSSPGARVGLAQAPQSPQVYPVPEFPYGTIVLGAIACATLSVLRYRRK